ncbi:MAG: hypothetical protein LBF88_10175 [Planctomycetaceae bacterium]|jgi:hypothetical protein|nr:hypothetical protein [Planctomycetaceae bacterium]
MLHKIIVSIILLVCFSIAGCKQRLPEGMPPLYPCTITLIQDGKPLDLASVSFYASDTENFWALAGTSNDQGVIEMTTNGPYKGVPAGVYKITVEKVKSEDIDVNRYCMVSLVDPQFGKRETTPIQIEIKPSKKKGVNDQTIDLGKENKKRMTPPLPKTKGFGEN